MTAWWDRTVWEWRTMPWTPRARRIGNALQLTGVFVAIMFGPSLVLAAVNWLVP